jgi:hypothetical protein
MSCGSLSSLCSRSATLNNDLDLLWLHRCLVLRSSFLLGAAGGPGPVLHVIGPYTPRSLRLPPALISSCHIGLFGPSSSNIYFTLVTAVLVVKNQ